MGIAAFDGKIDEMIAPFAAAARRLDEIPGINAIAACVILAEIGIDLERFPTAGHLVSWAKFAPGVKESAGKKKGKNTTGHGNSYLARVLGNAAVSAGRTDTFLGERYRRIARRRGRKKAEVAIGRSILVIIWHLLSDPQARYTDLGSDFYATPHQPRTPQAQPRPPARSPRLQSHPRTSSLTAAANQPSSAGRCRAPLTLRFSDQSLGGWPTGPGPRVRHGHRSHAAAP